MLIRRSLLVGSVVLLWIASIAPFSDQLCELIERQYPPIEVANATAADAILVLGGGIGAALPPRILPNLVTGASRPWYASRLLRAGKAPLVIAVGGGDSAATVKFLVELGVARASILQESRSRNTVENALYVKPILEAHGIRRSLLVTSALHMPRAVAIFRAVGIDVIPASADVEVVSGRKYVWSDFLPNAEALFRTSRIVHEVFGSLGFRVQIWLVERAI
jgi:uncharacterized SAM-binding protein YcdF (DUF218 family)